MAGNQKIVSGTIWLPVKLGIKIMNIAGKHGIFFDSGSPSCLHQLSPKTSSDGLGLGIGVNPNKL
jgi:hypothetical protein